MSNATHRLKILPEFYQAVALGVKTFEIRKNDRNYKVGDTLELVAHFNGENIGDVALVCDVVFITDYEQKPGYVVMAIHYLGEALISDDICHGAMKIPVGGWIDVDTVCDPQTKFIVRFLDGNAIIVNELNAARACVRAAWVRMHQGSSTRKQLDVFSVSLYREIPSEGVGHE